MLATGAKGQSQGTRTCVAMDCELVSECSGKGVTLPGKEALLVICVEDFPQAVKNLPANAGDTGLDPRSGKIPHGSEQLSLCTTTTEARVPEPVLCNKRSHRNEKTSHCNYSSPHSVQLEKAQQGRPSTATD